MLPRDAPACLERYKKLENKNQKTIFALVGPTCTFKTAIGVELAKKHSFEIISADSRLVYKGMDIGTSKPTQNEMSGVLHHMIDLVEPDNEYSVGLYKKQCEEIIHAKFKKEKTPLFVGGTGLYLNSILLGLSIPEVKPDLSFRRQLKDKSQEELYKRLNDLDPKACNFIHKNDNFRTLRALEVIYKTNKLFSELKIINKPPFEVVWLGLAYDDRDLHTKLIKKRAFSFCSNGLIDEVKSLLGKYGELDLFKRTIGYAEVIDFLKNKTKLEEMIEKIALHTRQFAKRQATWFRANKNIHWIYLDNLNYEEVLDRVFNFMQEGSFAKTSKVSRS